MAETASLFAPFPVRQGKGAYNAAPMGKSGSVSTPALPWPLAPVVVALGWVSMLGCGLLSRNLGLRPALLASEVGLALPAFLAVGLLRGPWSDALALHAIPRKVILLSLLAGAAFWAASLGLFELQYTVWRPPPGYLEAFERLHAALRPSGPFDALLSVGAIALAPAVFEELLFRGAVLPALLRPLGGAGAIVGSAALFGLIHLDFSTPGGAFYRVPFAFAVGLGLGILRVRTGALLPSTLAHALLNTITFVAEPLTEDPSAGLPDPRPLLGLALFAGGIVAAALVVKRIDSPQASP
jgi:membrane protease YdiL (CAAX protease family)